MKQSISKDEIVALIGRPLSSYEEQNFTILNELTSERLNKLLNGGFDSATDWTSGLKILYARLFNVSELERNHDTGISRKAVDGYSVDFKENTNYYAQFCEENADLIAKYRISNGGIRHGKTIYEDIRYFF